MTVYYFEGSPIVAPLTIESNEPVFAVDTINLKQQRASQGAQRWELSFQIQTRDIEEDYFVSMVTNASTAKSMTMPQLLSVDKKTTLPITGVASAANAGASSITVNFPSDNSFSFSEDFSNAYWTKTRTTVTPDAILAPSGYQVADALIDDLTASTTHVIGRSMSFVAGTTYTISMYVKQLANRNLRIDFPSALFGAVSSVAVFNSATGAVLSVSAGTTATSVDRGNGWYQVSITKTAVTTGSGTVNFFLTSGTATSYSGDGASGVYIWGAQFTTTAGLQPYTIYFLPKGSFIKFSNHNKIYMTTNNIETPGGSVTLQLYPTLRSNVTANTSLYHPGSSIKPTLQYYRDLETLQGITYEDGVIVNPGTIKLIEAL
jgi:hypothetical protein